MSKGMRLTLVVLAGFLGLSLLHVWLNVGFDKFAAAVGIERDDSFRVGFLPVT